MKKKMPINLKRMFMFPLIISILIIGMSGHITFFMTSNALRNVYIENSLDQANAYSNLVEKNHIIENQLYDDLNHHLITATNIVLAHRDKLSNEYLIEVLKMANIHYIWFYTPDGKIIYDSSLEYIGWETKPGDPIDNFINSGEMLRLDGIRMSTDDDRQYMIVYQKASDGYFVQAAIDAEYAINILNSHSYQNIVTEISSNNNVLYASIMNTDYEILADTRSDNAVSSSEFSCQEFQQGEINLEGHCTRLDKKVLEVKTPIVIDDEIVAFLNIGYSLEFVRTINTYAIIIIITLLTIIIFSLILTLYNQIIIPLSLLNKSLNSIDIKSGKYERPNKKVSSIENLFDSLDELSKKIISANDENTKLNFEIYKMAYTDHLTNIPNRMAFEIKLNELINKDESFALIYIDIDDFKTFNDTKGHLLGDKLIIEVSKRLSIIKETYFCFLGRYGGDEFVLFMQYEDITEVHKLCSDIIDNFNSSFFIDDLECVINLSIGISVFPYDGINIVELLRKADIAMYESKKLDKNRYLYYKDYMDDLIQNESRILDEIRKALKYDLFKILLQPQYDINTGEVVSYEALARIKNSEIGPNKFIKVAENAGLINSVGRVIIKKAIITLSTMKSQKVPLKPIYVNLSAKQFLDTSLISYIVELLKKHNLNSKYFGLELTESSLITSEEIALKFIDDLKVNNIKIVLDDFGSGYAGLNYLSKYKLEMVKLDKEFLRNYLCKDKLIVLNHIIDLIKLLDFTVLAEGVETIEQVYMLRETNCKLVQGYYYSKPLEVSEILKLYKKK